MIVGNALYIPQHYAYSQVEFLLCDTLDLGQAKPRQILKTSRFLMKGYKFQRFVLDLQLLPWYFLNWITFGIASFSLLPYIQNNHIFFYRALLAVNVEMDRAYKTSVVQDAGFLYLKSKILSRVKIAGPPCFRIIFLFILKNLHTKRSGNSISSQLPF